MKLFIVVVIGADTSGQDDQPECDPADERELHLPDLLPAPLGPAAGGAGALQQSHGTQRPCLVLQVDLLVNPSKKKEKKCGKFHIRV